MKQWMAKLGQGMARLAVWRKRAAHTEDAVVEPVFTAEADTAPAPDAQATPVTDPSPVATPVVAASSPPIIDDAFGDGLAELDDSMFVQVAPADTLEGDGLAELDDLSAPMQNETISADTLYTDNSTDGLAELDALSADEFDPADSEPAALDSAALDPAKSEPAPAGAAEMSSAEDVLASLTAAVDAAPAARPGLQDAEADADADAAPVSRLQRLISGLRRFARRNAADAPAQPELEDAEATPESDIAADAPQGSRLQRLIGRVRQFKPRRPNLKGLGPRLIGLVGKKRVWIPSVSLALLGVVGSLTFMLVQSSSEKAKLEADLSAAKQALKQAAVKPSVAVIPPLLAAPVPPADAQPAPADAPAAQPAAASLYVAQASTKGDPVQMGCDVSDKASVSLTLKSCIEAFNQATAR